MLENMKIKGKLGVGFGLLLIIMAVIALSGVYFIVSNNNAIDYLQNHPSTRYSTLSYKATDIMNLRRLATAMAYNAGNADELNRASNDILQVRAGLRINIDSYQNNLQADPRITESRRSELLGMARSLESHIMTYIHDVIDPMYIAASENDTVEIARLIALGGVVYAEIETRYDELMALATISINDLSAQVSDQANTAIIIMVVLVAIGFILGIVVAMIMANMITKPIKKVVSDLSDVASGKLNINMDTANLLNDETGELTRSVYELVEVIRDMINDLNNVYREFVEVGNLHYLIDHTKYKNSYSDMVSTVNKLLTATSTDMVTLGDMMEQLSDGDFNAELDPTSWVGDRKAIATSANGLSASLKNVNAEISAIIEAIAAKGDLSFQINTSKYNGDWQNLMAGLNDIIIAVESPIKVVEIALNEMKEGNLDLADVDRKISAAGLIAKPENYNGMFKHMLYTFDDTFIEISSYVDELNTLLAQMATGNLSVKIDRKYVGSFDSIKSSVNNITTILNKTMSEISSASEQVLSGARQISNSAAELASGAQEQASSVQELNATIDIINQQTQQNANNALTANELSNKSTISAQNGNQAMNQMVEAMIQIKESSNSISMIVKTIQDIAFQTNLLSLNASVEAARAGEHGKGFSVVADEVRSLAGRSQTAAAETTDLIQASINRVETGSSIVEATAKSLNAIVASASEVLEIISSISTASKEQAEAIANVSDGLTQISKVTQNNSAVSEETAATSEELNSQAEMLQQLVSFFKL